MLMGGRVFGHLLFTWFTFMVQLATERRPMNWAVIRQDDVKTYVKSGEYILNLDHFCQKSNPLEQ